MADTNLSSREVIEQLRRLYINIRTDYEKLKTRHAELLSEKEAPRPDETSNKCPSFELGPPDQEISEQEQTTSPKSGNGLEHTPTIISNNVENDTTDGDDDEDDKYVDHLPWMKDIEDTLKNLDVDVIE